MKAARNAEHPKALTIYRTRRRGICPSCSGSTQAGPRSPALQLRPARLKTAGKTAELLLLFDNRYPGSPLPGYFVSGGKACESAPDYCNVIVPVFH